jgi:hypothetical protein
MRQRIRSRLTYANVMATIAVFLVLSGGTAVALNGSNTVFSDDIVNGEVKNADIGSNAVGSGKIVDGSVQGVDIFDGTVDSPDILDGAVGNHDVRKNAITSGKVQDGSLTGADMQDGSLTGYDVANNSLGGQQIAESTLGEVPLAQVGGFGRDRYGGSCYPNGAAYVDCVVLTLNLPTRSPVLLIGATEAFPQNGAATGACKLVTQFGDVPNTAVDYHLPAGAIVPGSLVGITGLLGPGPVDFGIDCNQFSGTMEYFAHLAAIQIAPD